jgi:hypothetical protein
MSLLKKRKRLPMPSPRVGCPFCWDWLPPAEDLCRSFPSDFRGGRCGCGVVFVYDEIGRAGGDALFDALILACDGDIDKAKKLDSKTDCEVKTKPIGPELRNQRDRFQNHSPAAPKVWAVKLKH